MSLSPAEQERTRMELTRNLDQSGWTPERIATALGISLERVDMALAMTRARPADVWMVRDVLDEAVRQVGRSPEPYTHLSTGARASADAWFKLRPVSAARLAVQRDTCGAAAVNIGRINDRS